MADYAPPDGPPPPKIPEGWTARWNEQYQEWFYVNLYTHKSQWDKPTEPIYPPPESEYGPPGGPPTYEASTPNPPSDVTDSKKGALGSNNPYASQVGGPANDISEDEKLARQLQAEEDARATGGHSPMPGHTADRTGGGYGAPGGSASDFYNGPPQQPYGTQPGFHGQQPPVGYGQPGFGGHDDKGKQGGFLGKLKSKIGGSSSGQRLPFGAAGGHGSHPVPHGAPHGAPMPGAPYGGPIHPAFTHGPYGGHGAHPPKKSGHGKALAGGAALGAGAGLLGGALIADAAFDDNDYGGGDFDGGDFDGGDF